MSAHIPKVVEQQVDAVAHPRTLLLRSAGEGGGPTAEHSAAAHPRLFLQRKAGGAGLCRRERNVVSGESSADDIRLEDHTAIGARAAACRPARSP